VSAVEQLQAMAAKRQYKEAAGQLEVGIVVENVDNGYPFWILTKGSQC
jgi:hypothetical protein